MKFTSKKIQLKTMLYKLRLKIALILLEKNQSYDPRGNISLFLFSLVESEDIHEILKQFSELKKDELELGSLMDLTEDLSEKRKLFLVLRKCFSDKLKGDFDHVCVEYTGLLHLQLVFGLSDLERDLVLVFYLFEDRSHHELSPDLLGRFESDVSQIAASLLEKHPSEISKTLHFQGNLQRSGLISRKANRFKIGSLFVDFIGFSTAEESIWDRILQPVCLDHVDSDTEHLGIPPDVLSIMEKILNLPLPRSFLWVGPPGVGKSSAFLKIGKKLKLRLYKLRDQDIQGKASLEFRRSCISALCSAKPDPTLMLLIDECEMVLCTLGPFHSEEFDSKSWINGILERGLPFRTIWILNSQRFVCESSMRRFGFSFSFLRHGRTERENILRRALIANNFEPNERMIVAMGSYSLCAADIVQGVEQAREMGPLLHANELGSFLKVLYSNKLHTYGYGLNRDTPLGLIPTE